MAVLGFSPELSLLLRDVMERARTVEEGLDILRETPRTCEYYYVLSDKSRAMAYAHFDLKALVAYYQQVAPQREGAD